MVVAGIPVAVGARSPVWPLPDVTRKRWTFGADRAKGVRHHAGVDLYAPRGSVVLAPESGRLIARQAFVGPNSVALLMQTDTGLTLLFGEVEPESWLRMGLQIGSPVKAGQPIATVGINPGGSQMLHFEAYREGTRRNHRWYQGQQPPSELLNPTQYLKTAEALDGGQVDDGTDDDDPDEDEEDEAVRPDDIQPDILPQIDPGLPQSGGGGSGPGLLVLGLLLLYDWSENR